MNILKQVTLNIAIAGSLGAYGKSAADSNAASIIDSQGKDVTLLQAWLGSTAAVTLPCAPRP